jgi:methylase of polypeptide subunit release factors
MGTDISPDALGVAGANAACFGPSVPVAFVESRFSQLPRLATAIPEGLRPPTGLWTGFDVLLCNPPYSTLHDNSRLSRQALEMEPQLALVTENAFGAYKELAVAFNDIHSTGLNGYGEECVIYASGLVHSGTIVVFEIGAGQHDAVMEIFQAVHVLQFQRHILDYNQLIRGLLYRFV